MVVRTAISLNPKLLERFDKIIRAKGYTNRSEAIQDMIRNYIKDEKGKEVFAILKIFYDHRLGHFNDKIAELQHEYHCLISSVIRNYLGNRECLELLILKGKEERITVLANKLKKMKGVKECKLEKV